ncbi:MAG TPA: porin [Acidiphilium sp.]
MRKLLMASVATLGLVAGVSGTAFAQAAHPPAPGSLVVHLNGLLNDQINMIGSSAMNVGGYKLNPLGMSGYLRLYPGFDAQTEGGLQYGVAAELRMAYTSAGTGEDESTEATTVRRAYAYVGTAQAGFVRFGMTDGPWNLLSTGEYYDYGDGNNWNSDGGVGAAVPGVTAPKALFTSTGALYTTNKIVYISPDLFGFKAGFSYEPNSNAFKEGESCSYASIGCATLASAPGGAGDSRRKNTIEAAVLYAGEFSGVGVKLGGAYLMAAPIGNSTGAPIETIVSPETGSVTHITGYKTMGVAQISGQVTYAGFLLGANAKTGQVNTGYHFLMPGQRDLMFYEVTGMYTMGPATIGVQYFNNQSAGAYMPYNGLGRTETDYGADVGVNYALTPHFGVYAVYLYGHRHQAGYDFISSTASTAHNNVQSQAISVGTKFKW